jgi:hypothetical protein
MAPCGWTVTGCNCGSEWGDYSPEVRARAQAIAAHVMWAATGRQYGPCQITVMPAGQCAGRPDPDTEYRTYPVGGYGNGIVAPVIDNGLWFNRPRGACCNTSGCEVALDGPTRTSGIVSVTIGGDLVDEDAYVIQDAYLLVRVDGQCWPCCTNYRSPATAFTVVYEIGLVIPDAVQDAFETLACEVAKACAGGQCKLPRQITRLTRQGVDVEMVDLTPEPGGLLLTGLPDVDNIIRAENPNALMARPLVLSPDMPRPRRVTP